MAFQQSDLDKLDRAIASGLMKVRYADGAEMTYRTLAEMYETRARIAASLSSDPLPRTVLASF